MSDRDRFAKLDHAPLHRSHQLMFIGPGSEVEHDIKPIHLTGIVSSVQAGGRDLYNRRSHSQ